MNINIIIIALGILFYLVTCFAFMDVAKKDFVPIYMKAVWAIVVLIPFIGCLLYFIFGFKRDKKNKNQCA